MKLKQQRLEEFVALLVIQTEQDSAGQEEPVYVIMNVDMLAFIQVCHCKLKTEQLCKLQQCLSNFFQY